MRYYSPQRLVTPGSFPKPAGNQILEIHNYDEEGIDIPGSRYMSLAPEERFHDGPEVQS